MLRPAHYAVSGKRISQRQSGMKSGPSKAGVALTLSSGLDPLISEASHFARRFDVPLTLIHAGTSKEESRAQIQEAADRLGIAHEKKIVWNQADPAEAVMAAAAKENIDLLIVGAYEGPSLGKRRFIGPVAQTLARSAQCSLLVVAHPRVENHRFKRIVAVTDFSDSAKLACEQALSLAEADCAESFHVVSVHTVFMEARARLRIVTENSARTYQEEEQLLEKFLDDLPKGNIPVEGRVLRGTTGFVACDFADSVEADLLVLPSHHRQDGRILPMVDWAIRVLPCSLWLVHSGPSWTEPI